MAKERLMHANVLSEQGVYRSCHIYPSCPINYTQAGAFLRTLSNSYPLKSLSHPLSDREMHGRIFITLSLHCSYLNGHKLIIEVHMQPGWPSYQGKYSILRQLVAFLSHFLCYKFIISRHDDTRINETGRRTAL